MIYFLIFLNGFKFFGLEYTPPGFYVDEVAGVVQALCLLQTGRDFYGDFLPLFAPGVNDAFYTPAYLYGQAAWAALFGNSIFAFRAFIAFISALTIGLLYAWIKNESSKKIALYVAFAATIMPWSFHFSRIAWDPPLGVFFLIAALWANRRFANAFLTAALLTLAAYSYSPLRIAIPLIWLFYPRVNLKSKAWVCLWGLLLAIPLILQMQIPEFMARSELRSLWSPYSTNAYRNFDSMQLVWIGIEQFAAHFSPQFLFFGGDQNPRHSIGLFGQLSYLDGAALILGVLTWIILRFKKSSLACFSDAEKKLLIIALLGIVSNVIPAALTNEGNPHALRTIGCWPFYAILTGVLLHFLSRVFNSRHLYIGALSIGILFFSLYQYRLYWHYPTMAKAYFLPDASKINQAYALMTEQKLRCTDVPKEGKPRLPDELVRITLKRPILFNPKGYGSLYLGAHWHEQEPWGIWSQPDGAMLRFTNVPTQTRAITFDLKTIISPSHPEQALQVRVNGGPIQIFTLKDANSNTVVVPINPSDMNDARSLEIQFTTPGSATPIQAGISKDDSRALGIGLLSAKFQ